MPDMTGAQPSQDPPAVPYGQPAQYPGAPMPVAYRRPPLTSKQRNGAMLAGGLGLTIMTIGFSLFSLAGMALIVALVIGGVTGLIERAGGTTDGFYESLTLFINDYWWVAALAGLVGVIVWLAGYFTSVRILRSTGNGRATAITWSALGISIAAAWVLSSILSIGTSVAGVFRNDNDLWLQTVIVSSALSFAMTAAVGVFAWWWMAHAFRTDPAAPVRADKPAAYGRGVIAAADAGEHEYMSDTNPDEKSFEEKRHDQLTAAPKATEADAAPRVEVTDRGDGVKRIDWRDDAEVRPGGDPTAGR